MSQVTYENNKQKAKQVLILYSKLLSLQQSCWGQLFLFQKSELFQSFNRRFRLKDVFQIKLDDLIFLLILAGLMVLFNLLASDPSHLLFLAYRQFCIYLFISSMICLMVRPGIKYLLLLIYCVFVPVLMNGIYSKWLSLDPAQSLDTYSYMGHLSLFLVIGFTLVVYPLKGFIQKEIGSLYSYLYGLSIICLFGLWPIYSIIEEMIISSGTITLSIIYNNKSLVITFIVIIVFSFYLIVHKTFFQGNKQKLFQTLKTLFTSQEINKAIEEMQPTQIADYSWHNLTSRIMSLFVLATTLGLEIFIFFQMQNDSRNMIKSIALMIFGILFLIIGTFYVVLPVNNKFAIPIFTVLSLVTAPISFFYSQSLLYWEYICTVFSLPYIILFWTVIRGVSKFMPLLQNKTLAMMYVFIHTPIMIFTMDVLDYFGSGNTIGPVGYVSIAVIFLAMILAALYTIVKFCLKICQSSTQQTKNSTELDFTYSQPINYKPYKKSNTFTLSWVAEMNLLDMGVFINSFFYLVSNTIAFYSLNQLTYSFNESDFFSPTIYELTYAQFFILFIFMLYCHYFMSTNNDTWDMWMLTAWAVTGLVFVILSYTINVIPNSLRIFGGFCLVMFVVAIGFQYVKDSNKKIIPFVAPVLIFALWLTIVLPYAIVIPTASIYVSQTQFGTFIYTCILGSALLLILLVGIVSMIFNILMNKFEQEKRYKYVIEDVKAFLDEEGVQSNDQILHVFHQAYECRDRKYIFYLKNGYPINVTKDEQTDMFKLITYDNYVQRRTTQILPKIKEKETDCCWSFLTFFCGQDQDEINEKVKNALENNLINEEQAENLFPDDKMERLNRIMKANKVEKKEQKSGNKIKPKDIHSTKSLLLNSMAQGPRRLSPQYTLLKLQKQRKLCLQIYESIFELVSNNDKGQNLVIYNDFKRFTEMIKIQMDEKDCEELFNRYARSSWGVTVALNQQEFATSIQDIAFRVYNDSGKNIDQRGRIMHLLVQKIYYNLARFQEFNQMRRNFNKASFNPKFSPFNQSLQRFKQSQKQQQKQVSQLVHYYKKQKNHLDQPRKQNQQPSRRKKKQSNNDQVQIHDEEQQKGKSCKKSVYDNFVKVRDSCSSTSPVEQTKIIKRQKIKPWSYLAVQSAKILHRKYTLWEDKHQAKEYEFRLIFNNIFMAVFKLADLYTYLQITLRDPQVGWYDGANFSFLYIDYKYQLYLCLALAFITVPLGIKGISFISQDRLGLTQARVPAGFPHPMFFYTVIYKILVLSLFVTISSTFLVTFSCTWTQTVPYKMYLDQSIQCLSQQHNIYIVLSLVFLIIYFPLSSYTFPNFQFSEKRLDLKYRPSYLVLYFQINFVLVANKVLLSQDSSQQIEIAFISINIVCLLFLSLVCLKMKPCLIEWFNWVEFLSIFLGFVWNVGGLVLFLTKLWTLCVIIFTAITVVSIIVVAIIIKRVYFSSATVNAQNDEDEMKQLQLGRKYQKSKNKLIIAQTQDYDRNDSNMNKVKNISNYEIKNMDKQLIVVEDVISMTEQGGQDRAGNLSTIQLGKK